MTTLALMIYRDAMQITLEIKEALANWVLDSYPDVERAHARGIITPQGTTTTAEVKNQLFKYETLKTVEASEDAVRLLELDDKAKNVLLSDVFTIVTRFLDDQKTSKFKGPTELPESYLERFNFIPINNIQKDEVLLYNTHARILSELNFKAWERTLDKDEKAAALSRLRDSILVYDPYNLESFVPIEWENMNVMKVNLYQAPPWRSREGDPSLPCPPLIEKVFKHVFPDPTARRYVLNWIRNALLNRNETYLVLNGKKGLGKGLIADHIIPALVGHKHFAPAPVGIFTGQFNSVLDKKRVIFFDEFKVGKAEHTRLKRLINKFQNIEKKGVDADKREEIYNSYLVSNNDVADMYLEYDDRRFGVPNIGTTPITEVISVKLLDQLVADLEDGESDLIWQFGYWVFYHCEAPELNQFSVIRGRQFWRIVYASLHEWERFIVDKMVDEGEEELEVRQLGREFSRQGGGAAIFPRSITKIEDFLLNYKHEGKHHIGTIEKNAENEWVIKAFKRPDDGTDDL